MPEVYEYDRFIITVEEFIVTIFDPLTDNCKTFPKEFVMYFDVMEADHAVNIIKKEIGNKRKYRDETPLEYPNKIRRIY